MGAASRFDFFRIVLPGATVVALAYVVARTLLLAPRGGGLDGAAAVVALVESPFHAAVVAFGVGLVLYLVDPAYRAPQFWKDIPSTHLQERLRLHGVEGADEISLTLLAMDELMPGALQERAHLFGALYRAGFQLVIYLLACGAVLPALAVVSASSELPRGPTALSASLAVVVVVAGGVPLAFQIRRRERGDRGTQFGRDVEAVTAGGVVLAVLAWTTWFFVRWSWLAVLPAVTAAAWLVLRHVGPYAEFKRWLGDPSARRPDVPHRPHETVLLDVGMATWGAVGLVAAGAALHPAQVIASSTMLVVGLVLSFARKHEKQLYGIYRNQNLWLDVHLPEIIEMHERAAAAREP